MANIYGSSDDEELPVELSVEEVSELIREIRDNLKEIIAEKKERDWKEIRLFMMEFYRK